MSAPGDAPPPVPPPPPAAAKPRNPIERALVWGFIAVMGGVVAIEGVSWTGHRAAMKALSDQVAASDTGGPPVKGADVKKAVGNRTPVDSGNVTNDIAISAKRYEVYSWYTLGPNKRELWVYYGHDELDPEVVEVSSARALTINEKYPDPAPVGDGSPPPMSGAPSRPPGGPPAGVLGGPGGVGGPDGAAPELPRPRDPPPNTPTDGPGASETDQPAETDAAEDAPAEDSPSN